MKVLLKYMAVFVISSVIIPLTCVYFGQVFSEIKEILGALM